MRNYSTDVFLFNYEKLNTLPRQKANRTAMYIHTKQW